MLRYIALLAIVCQPAMAQLLGPTETIGSAETPATPSAAAPKSITLAGNSAYDAWGSLNLNTIPGSGSFPGMTMWNPVNSLTHSGVDGFAQLKKIANGAGGGPYGASGSIYFGGFGGTPNTNGGTLAVADATPVSGLESIVLQLQFGEASGYDFFDAGTAGYDLSDFPLLYINGSEVAIQAGYVNKVVQAFTGTVEMPSGIEPVYVNLWAFQWDLSGVTDPITSFEIQFKGVEHSQLYGIRLDQSDTFTQVVPEAVPEPSTWLLLGLGLTALVVFRVRSRRLSA